MTKVATVAHMCLVASNWANPEMTTLPLLINSSAGASSLVN
jgi:hypothetical protein